MQRLLLQEVLSGPDDAEQPSSDAAGRQVRSSPALGTGGDTRTASPTGRSE